MEADLKGAIEFLPERLYYVSVRGAPPASMCSRAHFFCIDNELVYWNFFLDFGPLNLGQLWRFSQKLNDKLQDPALKGKVIYFYCGQHPHRRANAAFLISAWAMLYLEQTPDEAFRPFRGIYPPFPPFHDASPCACTFDLTILDVLRGLAKARKYNFFDDQNFDVEEYEHFEQVENGDLNWLVYGKFVAFAGPHDTRTITADGYPTLTPADYVPYFKKKGLSLVVRLNKKYYDERKVTDAGIDHMELYYLDGSNPPLRILNRFIQACEATPGAIGVHCKAGLGRTGTCIGCYLMKHFKFTAAEVIGWIRLCRPGSIIGPQQHFMREMEQTMWREGDLFRKAQSMKKPRTTGDAETKGGAPAYGALAEGLGSLAIAPSLGRPGGGEAKGGAGAHAHDDGDDGIEPIGGGDHKLPQARGAMGGDAGAPPSPKKGGVVGAGEVDPFGVGQAESLRARRHEQANQRAAAAAAPAPAATASGGRSGMSWTRSGLTRKEGGR